MQRSAYWIGVGLLALACDAGRSTAAGPSTAPATGGVTSQVTLTVSAANPQPVSSSFFGQNYWSWVTAWGDPVATIEPQAKELGIKLLRAGGANNDQQNPERFNEAEIDGFVDYARAVGAEPMLQVPVLKGPTGAAATAQDAAELVRYVNVTRAYGIRYFSIGNEPDLYTEQKFRDASFDASAACATFAEFAKAMKQVDPSILVLGPELSWKYRRGGNDWLTPFLQGCGTEIDI
ncbi:MAG TPA: glycoside hydrolase family 44 protein, partial [Polyangiaceae bacterium]|nr:glycoside hydrolase family 44 protein [Polyangiaceae bacterium]